MLRIFRHYIPLPTLAISALEIFFLFSAFYIYHFKSGYISGSGQQNFYYSLGFAVAIFMMMFSLGLYNRPIFAKYREMLIRIALSFCFMLPIFMLVTGVINRYLPNAAAPSNETYLPGMLLGLFAVTGTRFLILPMIDVAALKKRVLVIGVGDLARRIERLVSSHANRGFFVVEFVRFGNEGPCIGSKYLDVNSLPGQSIAQLAEQKFVDEIVIASRDRRGLPIDDLLDCKLKGISITEYLTFWERETGQIDLEALQPSWLFFSDGFRMNWLPLVLKRSFDIVVSLVFVVLTAPVIAVTAAAIRLEGPGPIFYIQERVGLNGRRFPLMKFRSMSVNAETDGVPRWAANNDQRITRIGALIRKTRIDEIPQILNVLKGDMSFIGPRPERPFFVETLAKEIPYYSERHRVKPGISGWAQINYPYGASIEDAREKLTFDLYYVKNRGLFLDFVILLQTARVVLWPEGVR